MSRPDDIPEDVWEAAEEALSDKWDKPPRLMPNGNEPYLARNGAERWITARSWRTIQQQR